MTPDDIVRLSAAARRCGIAALEWTDAEMSLKLRFETAGTSTTLDPTENAVSMPAVATPRVIQAPAVGTFRHRHPATDRPVAKAGERVEAGRVVGFVQAGAMLHPVTASEAGTLGAPLCQDGAAVGYGTPLYVVS